MANEERTSAALGRLRGCIALCLQSIESYERHGMRTSDKLVNDMRMVATACFDVIVDLRSRT